MKAKGCVQKKVKTSEITKAYAGLVAQASQSFRDSRIATSSRPPWAMKWGSLKTENQNTCTDAKNTIRPIALSAETQA